VAAAESQNGNKVSSAWFKEDIAESKATGKSTVTTPKSKPKVKVKNQSEVIPKPDEILPKDNLSKEFAHSQPLKTASSLRNRPKPSLRKKVEVSWEAHENAPNIWFLVISILLTLFAGLILMAMLYIR
jgi:hypothetical protein